MQKHNNDSLLLANGVKPEVIPFYQLWLELLDARTLDIYQYRILYPINALEELLEVIEKTIDGVYTNDANLEFCREESLSIIKKDLVMESQFKLIQTQLLSALGTKPKELADKYRLRARVRCIYKQIKDTYIIKTFDELKDSILCGDIEKMSQLANCIASQAVTRGWSTKALLDLMRFFRSKKEFDEQWNDFVRRLNDDIKSDHKVIISVPFLPNSEEEIVKMTIALGKLGIEPQTHDEVVSLMPNVTDLRTLLNAEKKYFVVDVKAYDIYSAAHLALCKVSDKLNLASFYNLIGAWKISSITMVSINLASNYHRSLTANSLYQTYDYLDSSNIIFDATKRIYMDNRYNEICGKLQGAFGYANISRSSLVQEEKYMNLWVALESLSRTKMYSDIISCVKETVPAAEVQRYLYRVVRNFVEDCARCNVSIKKLGNEIDVHQESKQKMVCEVITVLKNPCDYEILQENCRVNTLLRYRVACVRDLVTDIDKMAEKIKNHYEKVRWQIQRLYRIRNEIVHSALQERSLLLVYIEHLYDYLSKYIAEIVTCVDENKYETIEETLCHIKGNYELFDSLSKDDRSKSLLSDILDTGVIDLFQ